MNLASRNWAREGSFLSPRGDSVKGSKYDLIHTSQWENTVFPMHQNKRDCLGEKRNSGSWKNILESWTDRVARPTCLPLENTWPCSCRSPSKKEGRATPATSEAAPCAARSHVYRRHPRLLDVSRWSHPIVSTFGICFIFFSSICHQLLSGGGVVLHRPANCQVSAEATRPRLSGREASALPAEWWCRSESKARSSEEEGIRKTKIRILGEPGQATQISWCVYH